MGRVPTLNCSLLRSTTTTTSTSTHSSRTTFNSQQIRHATFIPRPRRPYTFTQLVTLSDGSSYTVRTTSPQPIYRATKDTRNTLTWQPSERALKNVELDEAGRLAAFRERFGRAFDTKAVTEEEEGGEQVAKAKEDQEQDEGYGDLITSYAAVDADADAGKKKKK